jgi:hypothetical protein
MEDKTAQNLLEFKFDEVKFGQRRIELQGDANNEPQAPIVWVSPPKGAGKQPNDLLVIRDAQMEALRQIGEKNIRQFQIYDILREDYSELVDDLADPVLQQRIAVAIERASRYRITSAEDILSFFVLMCRLSPRFDEHPAIYPLLTTETFRPDDLYDILQENLSAIDILHVIASGSSDSWTEGN